MSVGEFWPEKGVQKNEWALNHRQNAPVSLSGDSVVTDFGEPFWTAEVSVEVPIRGPLERQWSAFFRRRRGQKNTFTMNRSFRSFPTNGGDDSALFVQSINRAESTALLGGLVLKSMSEGDMLSWFTENDGYYIGEVAQLISNSNGFDRVELDPPPFTPHDTTPNVRRVKSIGEFRMDGPPSISETHVSRSFSFSATQVIRG